MTARDKRKPRPRYEVWHRARDPHDPSLRASCQYDRRTVCHLHIDEVDGEVVADLRLWRNGEMIAGSGCDGEWRILSLWFPRENWPREIEAGARYERRSKVPQAIIRELNAAARRVAKHGKV